jgi:FtsH-binding integral membrane protein
MSDRTIDSITVSGFRDAGDARTVFSQTMGLVAVTAGLFAVGAYTGRDLTPGWGWVFFIAAFASLIGMRSAVRKPNASAVGLLFVFGSVIGLATAPTLAFYASANPQAVWEAGAATALFITALGAAGYGSRADLSALARVSSWALVTLIIFAIVVIFAQIPNASVIYSVLGLIIFAGLTIVDFQRLRRAGSTRSAPLLAASIFLDALNVFFFFLTIFDSER